MMPTVNIENSEQNAFVQDWLGAWAKEHTVFGTNDWYKAAREKIEGDPKWAKQWGVTTDKLVRDAAVFESIYDHIQDTYDCMDHEKRKKHPDVDTLLFVADVLHSFYRASERDGTIPMDAEPMRAIALAGAFFRSVATHSSFDPQRTP